MKKSLFTLFAILCIILTSGCTAKNLKKAEQKNIYMESTQYNIAHDKYPDAYTIKKSVTKIDKGYKEGGKSSIRTRQVLSFHQGAYIVKSMIKICLYSGPCYTTTYWEYVVMRQFPLMEMKYHAQTSMGDGTKKGYIGMLEVTLIKLRGLKSMIDGDPRFFINNQTCRLKNVVLAPLDYEKLGRLARKIQPKGKYLTLHKTEKAYATIALYYLALAGCYDQQPERKRHVIKLGRKLHQKLK